VSGGRPSGDPFPRPVLVVSRCLGFEPVRYNGQVIEDDFVQRLARFCEPIVVCPEVEIGLGVPRPPIRLVHAGEEGTRVQQPGTGRDLTAEMHAFGDRFLEGLDVADGFVLKSRSPSCGLRDVKLFDSAEATTPLSAREAGAFGSAVLARFPWAAIEDEARLGDPALRDRFLTLLFALATLRAVDASGEWSALKAFHAGHRELLLGSGNDASDELDRWVARSQGRPWVQALAGYRERLARSLARPAREPAGAATAPTPPYPPELAR